MSADSRPTLLQGVRARQGSSGRRYENMFSFGKRTATGARNRAPVVVSFYRRRAGVFCAGDGETCTAETRSGDRAVGLRGSFVLPIWRKGSGDFP